MIEAKQSAWLCRVCLQTLTSKGLSLFENYKHAPIFEHINLLTKLEIKEDDGFPNRICTSCLMELEAVLNFTQKCRNSDFILKNNPGDIKLELPLEYEDKEELVKDEGPDDEPAYDDTGVIDDDDIYASILTDDIIPEKPGKPEFECHDCGNFFKSKCKLRVHWKKVHLPEQLVCKICKKQCQTYRTLHSHMKRNSSYCRLGLKVNIEGTGKNRLYFCKHCNYKSNNPNNIKQHIVVHSYDKPYQCKICSKRFSQTSSLHTHVENVHKQYRVEIDCEFCGKHIKGRGSVYRHLKTHNSLRFKCEVCPAILKSKACLRVHMLRHAGPKSFTCELCAKPFYTLSELTTHRRVRHDKTKRFSCTKCAFKCKTKDVLKRHILKHTDSNVCCVTCGVFFNTNELWRKHQKCHTELKHKCLVCDKGFSTKDTVTKHIKSVHLGIKKEKKKKNKETLS